MTDTFITPIVAMTEVYTDRSRKSSADARKRFLSVLAGCEGSLKSNVNYTEVVLPPLLRPVDLKLYADSNMPFIAEDALEYIFRKCRVCGKPYFWAKDIREGCSERCRYEVSTRFEGSAHWTNSSCCGELAKRTVAVSSLPSWQRLFAINLTDRHTVSESRLIMSLYLGYPLPSARSTVDDQGRVIMSPDNRIEHLGRPLCLATLKLKE